MIRILALVYLRKRPYISLAKIYGTILCAKKSF